MSKGIMFQGTGSGVGKSILTAAFCRIFKQDGYSVAPFKSQNMALNSFITKDGMEMGRAQVFQAEAAGLEPDVRMNPILLKPTTDKKSQVIINGKVYKNMNAVEYFDFKPQLIDMVQGTYDDLSKDYDVTVIEGAGSPAEINLKHKDLVNMGMAKMAKSPVILVGDIDRGGVFAWLAGTIQLLEEDEKTLVKGVIINKFRGDVKILEPGLRMLEDIIKIPVLGVIPYMDVKIEDEDSLAERFTRKSSGSGDIEVAAIHLPHVSNFTDLNVFETQEDVHLRYVMRGDSIGNPDLIIIPGSKNTIEDLIYLKESGLESEIKKLHDKGTLVFGICGGYQMLGKKIYDPKGIECGIEEIEGLGLLDIETTFEGEKVTTQVNAVIEPGHLGHYQNLGDMEVEGYEIHMGRSTLGPHSKHFGRIVKRLEEDANDAEGAISNDGKAAGTYLHGIFDNINFTRALLNNIRKEKGLDEIQSSVSSFKEFKEKEYDNIANKVRASVDMDAIYKILNEGV